MSAMRSAAAPARTLRRQKTRKKRYGGREQRGTMPNQGSIEQRLAIVNRRKRRLDRILGHNVLIENQVSSGLLRR